MSASNSEARPLRQLLLRTVLVTIGISVVILPALPLAIATAIWPRQVLSRLSVALGLSALFVVLSSLVTGQFDWLFAPALALSALAIGAGQAAFLELRIRHFQLIVLGATIGLFTMLLATVMDSASSSDSVLRSSGWFMQANLWAAAALPATLGTAAWFVTRKQALLALVTGSMGLLLVVLTGSRAVFIGLAVGLLFVAGSWLVSAAGNRRGGLVGLSIVLVALVAVPLIISPTWRARTLGVLIPRALQVQSSNLLVSSENLLDPVWWKPDITVERDASASTAVHWLSRSEGVWTSRVQQRVTLEPASTYTISVEFHLSGVGANPLPAVVGWAQNQVEGSGLVVVFDDSGIVQRDSSGAIELVSATVEPSGDWSKLEVTFRNSSEQALRMELGVAPRTLETDDTYSSLGLRGLQLESGPTATPYVGTGEPDRRHLQAASAIQTRIETYQQLLPKILERPWFGWGAHGYDLAVAESTSAPEHEHSLPLALTLRFGVVGLVAFVLAFIGLGYGSMGAVALAIGVGVANLFDLSFPVAEIYTPASLFAGAFRASGTKIARPLNQAIEGGSSE